MIDKIRCDWCESDDEYISYHDNEWGVPLYDDIKLFEFLMLEGMQAGLSWITVLKKRDNYRQAFANFNPEKIAKFDDKKIEALMENKGIIRHRLKIKAIINNAKIYIQLTQTQSFSDYLWGFVNHQPKINHWQHLSEVPSTTNTAMEMSKSLKKLGFKFVGPTICYAFMQATGMVNDHLVSCFCSNTNVKK